MEDELQLSVACSGLADCGEHVLNCGPTGVVRVKGAVHGYKSPEAQPYCQPQSRDLCLADPDPCCKFSNFSDCLQVSEYSFDCLHASALMRVFAVQYLLILLKTAF